MTSTDRMLGVRSFLLSAMGLGLAGCGVQGSGAGDGGTAGDGGAGPASFSCQSPTPYAVGGQATGFESCEGGSLVRKEVRDCPTLLPRASGGPARRPAQTVRPSRVPARVMQNARKISMVSVG
jgi:hypothetical protein